MPLPFTLRGVGRFATAPWSLLLLTELVAALGLAAVFAWFVNASWFSQVTVAIRNLPGRGALERGALVWQGDSPVQLAGNNFIAFAIDLDHEADLGHEADLCIELGADNMRVCSLLGYVQFEYPKSWRVKLERAQLEPWWNAWAPAILACAAVGLVMVLFALWTAFALLYAPVAALVAFLANRRLDARGAFKLASAAQIPGAIMTALGGVLYGLGWFDLVKFGGCVAAQFILTWFFVLGAPFTLNRLDSPETFRGNPFARTGPTLAASEPADVKPEDEPRSKDAAHP
ncbi:MAG: hypothetical protein NZ739_11785 [Verrucomicrobiae bacterium]|nr:hypothetical protein [Verrucomicrobiae bacterium]